MTAFVIRLSSDFTIWQSAAFRAPPRGPFSCTSGRKGAAGCAPGLAQHHSTGQGEMMVPNMGATGSNLHSGMLVSDRAADST